MLLIFKIFKMSYFKLKQMGALLTFQHFKKSLGLKLKKGDEAKYSLF